jgi:hypothetical protein
MYLKTAKSLVIDVANIRIIDFVGYYTFGTQQFFILNSLPLPHGKPQTTKGK